jgi:hypothetical protein
MRTVKAAWDPSISEYGSAVLQQRFGSTAGSTAVRQYSSKPFR